MTKAAAFLLLLAFCLVVAGAALLSVPAGLITAGLLVAGLGVMQLDVRKAKR
jgi:hypothetical protein